VGVSLLEAELGTEVDTDVSKSVAAGLPVVALPDSDAVEDGSGGAAVNGTSDVGLERIFWLCWTYAMKPAKRSIAVCGGFAFCMFNA
jgi:hypothetical protein